MHDSIAAQVLALCRERGLTLSAAESITGGLIAKCITDVPGASQVFLGGVVSYTNEVKNHVLGVPSSLLTGSDLAVAVTGLAGPDGDDRGNPVGTVFAALSAPEGVFVRRLALSGDREHIRALTAHHAFDLLINQLAEGE